mgnify:FL=1
MATEMEIRVARAVAEAIYENEPKMISWHTPTDSEWEAACISVSRAAIRALREPTDEMLSAAQEIYGRPSKAFAKAVWQAIDRKSVV